MKLTTKLSLTTLFLIACALTLLGCEGDNGGGTPDGHIDEDIVENDMSQGPDCNDPYFCEKDSKQPDQKDFEGEDLIPEIEEPMPEIFLWWKADWKCISYETCWVVGEPYIMTLEIDGDGWDAEKQVAHFFGLTPCDHWEITHDGTSFQMTGYTMDGVGTCKLEEVNGELITISQIYDGVPGDNLWTWERQ